MFSIVLPNTELFISLKRSFSKLFFASRSKLCVKIDVGFQPCTLVNFIQAMNLLKNLPMFESLAQCSYVNNVIPLIV